MSFDIIAIGDTTTDIFLDIDENSKLCKVDKRTQELKFKFKSKIPVMGVHRVIGGGNAPNHVMGASRLGLKTAIYTVVGHDDVGDSFYHKIDKEGISNKYISYDSKNGTNLSTIIDYDEERTVLSYHADRKYKLPEFENTKWIYFSSISGNHDEFNEQLVNYIKNNSVKLAFNPGSRQMILGLVKLKKIFEVSDIVFVNKSEAERLVGEASSIKNLMKKFYNLGMKIAVITDGQKGSYSFDGTTFYKINIFKSKVLETTGCGDAYGSGFLSAIIKKKTIAEAMKWGSINASSVISKIGSQDGLLTKKQMESILSKHDYFQARIL
ncbi:MAG: hypothetical protein A2725_00330 [Candidatus Magasanikbacteria bacterium RIFCSPHIGHO2_01_FULL_33_34]|uniref:Carbohydrate kinase PfkB domain-containing protein n=1 Tax=Candidatus Magasanikbacteria bacterium RIFCSPHIGHO2_01_FULL_33_34 TaxID=1798671 RepID=A0A1F6LL20_9BACT|nr:MAG: hypothetical protein A2725_00330 [Candidatus Magasanikbacteria bacterium RIFCSPHIGHO2_01_FULL_33_34]OGH65807.1 MAG: hypothetical protein A3B83_03000 [Candidatus Magasanikbacteria bacterium RIFCSPHIGHO2_02_FULL_33_17]OGH75172.1 MAG: hypothetical protein A3A89_03595 [Candidatus Magasanikbacteria bacterium RIFCSPLOWO2_01_FULL_33_34]OGH81293.1 MAG: hypothetical protein A3F93_01535 [Candidatus Magasanikbacteria bacterium RIFCSPLOWO2_12_FULL_34_7]